MPKQPATIEGFRLGINIMLIIFGLLYFVTSHGSLIVRILVGVGQYVFFRTLAQKMLIDPLDGQSRVFRKLGLVARLSTEPNPYDTFTTIGEGLHSGLKVRITETAKSLNEEGPHQQFYVIQVETAEKDLDLIIQNGKPKTNRGRKRVAGFSSLSKRLSRYNAVSNDPVRARSVIESNRSSAELLIAGSICLLLNVKLNEAVVDEQENYFEDSGVLTLIRDGSIAYNEYTFTKLLDALVELSKSLSSTNTTLCK